MGKEKTLTILPAVWCDEAEYWLVRAVDELDNVRADVQAGRAVLLLVYCDAEQVGAIVLRRERLETHDEGVIVAAAGRAPGVRLIRELLPNIEQRFPGVERVRVHTRRRGMLRELQRAGYQLQEFVLSKPVVEHTRDDCANCRLKSVEAFKPIPQQQQQQQGGGGGGGSSSSSSSTTQTANIDKRLVVDAGTGVSADQSTVSVSVLDGGAVANALQFGRESMAGAGYYGQAALESGANLGALAIASAEKSAKFGIDLSQLTVDRVLDIADTVFGGAFSVIDKNAQLIERSGTLVDKAYADAKGSGAERFYVAAGVVAAVAIVAVYAGKR